MKARISLAAALLAIAATLMMLFGCAEERRSQVQYDFVRKLDTVKSDLSDLQMSWLFNKGEGGKLPPEDLDQQIVAKKVELAALFRNPPVADSWNASVVSLALSSSLPATVVPRTC